MALKADRMTLSLNGSASSPDAIIQRAIADSAQIPPSVTRDGITAGGFGLSYEPRGPVLPAWGTRQREYALDSLYKRDEMNLIRGAFVGLSKAIASLPWEIKGDEKEDETFGTMASSQGWRLNKNNGVEYFQEVFRQANFGGGWGELICQLVLDFLCYDAGGYIEVIAPGDAYDKPHGAITGIAHLDPLRTYPTGDPRYPAVYYDRYGGLHVMHHSRVIRMVDMLRGSEMHPGYGDSALSRAASIAIQEVWIQRYITSRLDDLPPPGVTIFGGIVQQQWDAKIMQYQARQNTDAKPIFGDRMNYFVPDMQYMPKIENYDFQSSPEKFDYRVYTDINVDRLALVLGVDRQELMQLSGGGAIGSQGQSNVLAQKARGKTIGFLLQQLERKLNDLLPDEYTFEFKYRDSQEVLEDAQKAQLWATVAATVGAALNPNEQRTLLANEVEAIRDAIQDAPRANDVINQPFTAEDNTAGAAPVAPAVSPPNVNVNDDTNDEIGAKAITQKDYSTTQAMFVQDVRDLLMSAITPNPYLDRRAFGVTMRSFLKNYGLKAYKDGLSQGGVNVEVLDPEDNSEYMRVFVEQSQYISGLAEDVFKNKSVTPANVYDRAIMWGKSLQVFNDEGLASADANGMYMYHRGMTSDSCVDCRHLDGQVHRLKTFKARGKMPRSNRLACKGYRCLCYLERTTERARGRF
jgi:hypothetical protein